MISVVVPIYNEEKVINVFNKRLIAVLKSLNKGYEILYVNDGSYDNTLKILKNIKYHTKCVKIINFSRNFGHQVAITAGIDHAKGDAVVVIDADLQDPPELIDDMVKQWEKGYEVVYAQRKRRTGENIMKTLTAKLFYRLIKQLTDIHIPVDVGDYRLMSRKAVDHLKRLREKHRYVRGMVVWIGFKQIGVKYRREPRYAGTTHYPWGKMIKFSIDGLSSFSTLPLRLATFVGFASALMAFIGIIWALYVKIVLDLAVQGWASLIVIVFFLGGVQLISIGILGEYIGRIYIESKDRPLYIIEDIY